MSFTSLSFAFICLWLCGSDGVVSRFKIYRSKRDIFTNLKCTDDTCTEYHCDMYGAECVSEDNCKYCRCLEGRNTFMTSGIDQGKCKSDEDIEPNSVPNDAFWLKNNQHEKCLHEFKGKFIIGKNCTVPPTNDMLWIRIGGGKVMNVKTLKCMTISKTGEGRVNLYRGWKNTSARQNVWCDQENDGMEIWWWKGEKRLYLPTYMNPNGPFAISSMQTSQTWSSNQTSCPIKTTYEGCYRFRDGSFMRYLNYESNPNLRISAPIFAENSGSCSVWEKFKFIRDGQQWKDGNGRLFNITKVNDATKQLKIISIENLKYWNGSLLNFTVSCRKDNKKESYCVLLKLKSLPTYSQELPTENSSVSTKETFLFTSPTYSTNSRRRTTDNPDSDDVSEEKSEESGGTNTAVFAVTVTLLLVVLALILGFLFYYRRRKRAQASEKNNNELGVVNYSPEIYENPDRMYETLNGNAVSPHEPGTSSDLYTLPNTKTTANLPSNEQERNGASPNTPERPSDLYSVPDEKITANPPSNDQEYVYARETDFPRNKGQNNGGLHKTYEQSETPKDEFLYTLPQKTKKDKPPSDIDHTNANDDTMPNAFYHTLEQEEPAAPDDEEYSYAKNTEIPLIPVSAQRNNGNTSPPEEPAAPDEEYSYAKNTEIPLIPICAQQDSDKSSPPESTKLHSTLEEPTATASHDEEYSYAKNTEIPLIPICAQQNNDNSSPPDSSGLYSSPDEPEPPQPHVYSNVEEPADNAVSQK